MHRDLLMLIAIGVLSGGALGQAPVFRDGVIGGVSDASARGLEPVMFHAGDKASGPEVVEAPSAVWFRTGDQLYQDLAGYAWRESPAGEYVLLAGDGRPFDASGFSGFVIYSGGRGMERGEAGSLSVDERTGLGTFGVAVSGRVHVRLAEDKTPAEAELVASYDNPAFSWGAGSASTSRVEWSVDGEVKRRGFAFAHWFTEPGEHTVTMTITNQAGVTRRVRRTVRVTPDRRRQVRIGPDGAYPTLGEALAQEGRHRHNVHYKLRRGHTYKQPDTLRLRGQNTRLSAWGSGGEDAMPVIQFTGDGQPLMMQAANQAVQDVAFVAPEDREPVMLWVGGTKHALINCEIRGGYSYGMTSNQFDRALIQNVRGVNKAWDGSNAYFLWAGLNNQTHPLKQLCIYDSDNGYRSREEAVIRAAGDYISLDGNELSQHKPGKNAYRHMGGSNLYLSGNSFRGASVSWSPPGSAHRVERMVVERNLFLGEGWSIGASGLTGRDWTFRSNVFDQRAFTPQGDRPPGIRNAAIRLGGMDFSGIRVLHNTYVTSVKQPVFLVAKGQKNKDPWLTVANNLGVAPNAVSGPNSTWSGRYMAVSDAGDQARQAFVSLKGNVSWSPDRPEGDAHSYLRPDHIVSFNWPTYSWETVNGWGYASGNREIDVTLGKRYEVTSGRSKLSVEEVSGALVDFHGRVMPANPVAGAVQ